jgi:hypothetical protein
MFCLSIRLLAHMRFAIELSELQALGRLQVDQRRSLDLVQILRLDQVAGMDFEFVAVWVEHRFLRSQAVDSMKALVAVDRMVSLVRGKRAALGKKHWRLAR